MSIFTTLMILVLLGSVSFCALTINRLLAYNKKYHLPESQYTKLGHFISKEHIAVVYVALTITNIVFGIWFLITI
jgi:hypothetical protein